MPSSVRQPRVARNAKSPTAPASCWTTLVLANVLVTKSRTLAYGEQRRLEIARALATDPKMIALDEPAAGMNATETVALRQLIRAHRPRWHHGNADRAHDMRLVMNVCQHIAGARLRPQNRRWHAGRNPEGRRRHQGLLGGAHGDAEEQEMSAMLEVKKLEVAYGGIKRPSGH